MRPRILFHSAASLSWVPRSSLCLLVHSESELSPAKGALKTGVHVRGGHSQEAFTSSSLRGPEVAADAWLPLPLQKPLYSGPACPDLPPSPIKVLEGSLHLLATLLSPGLLPGSIQTGQQLPWSTGCQSSQAHGV